LSTDAVNPEADPASEAKCGKDQTADGRVDAKEIDEKCH
jgi:hypothetical protein